MDFPIPATITDATPEPLAYDSEAKIVINSAPPYYAPELSLRTAGELSRVWRDNANNENALRNTRSRIDEVREYLVENYEEIGSEHADEIARLLSIDLSKTIDVTFKVEITATISLPPGKSFDDLSEYDFDITIESNESDYEIDSFDAEITRMTEDS